MRLWAYVRPFQYKDEYYTVKFYFSFLTYTSQLFCNGTLIDECTHPFKSELKVIEHMFQHNSQTSKITVSVGYYSWWNIGIEVRENNNLIYSSHPNKNIHFVENKIVGLNTAINTSDSIEKSKQQSDKWQKNKHSIFADIFLGAVFFIVAKVTGDLTIAAFTGVTLGLGLVVLQRFVKVDLLGGFAVFGTNLCKVGWTIYTLFILGKGLLQATRKQRKATQYYY